MRYPISVMVSVIFISVMAATALGDEKADAKKHYKAGLALAKVDDFKGAAAEFEQSIKLYPTKSAMFNLANCYKATHRYGEALTLLDKLDAEYKNKMKPWMREDAAKMREEILGIIAKLTIQVNVDGAEVALDGERLGQSPVEKELLIGPGKHTIRVIAEGYVRQEIEIEAVSGDQINQEIALLTEKGTLALNTNVKGAQVFIDEQLMGSTPMKEVVELDPGPHTVKLVAEGYEETAQEVQLVAGQKAAVTVVMSKIVVAPEPVAEPVNKDYPMNPYKKAGHATFWTGLGFVAFGGVATGLAKSYGDDFNESRDTADSDKSMTWETLMWAGYGTGAALMVTGITLWALSPGDESWAKKNGIAIAPIFDGKTAGLMIEGRF